MNSKIKIWVGIILFCSIVATIYTFVKNREAPPVSDLEIPQSTKDFFRKLSEFGHIQIEWVKKLRKKDYNNENDEGQTSGEFKFIEDDNFIVYYRDNESQKIRAEKTIGYANEAITPLSDLFGTYHYAARVKGRKLPIYLAAKESDFAEICDKLGVNAPQWAAGVTYMQFSSTGENLCKGIVLANMVVDEGPNFLKVVLWHEMAHYDHLTSIDLYKKNGYLGWECEGIASYFANEDRQVPNSSALNTIELDKECNNYMDNYWVGFKVYKYMESAHGKNEVKDFLQKSYTENAITVIPLISNQSFQLFEDGWRKYCLGGN